MKYIGNINDVITTELRELCNERAKLFNPHGRSLRTVQEQTLYGEAVEVLVCKTLGLTQTSFDVIDYDAVNAEGEKYEIKHTVLNNKYWNLKMTNYNHFIKCSYKLDKIVLAYTDKATGGVYLKFSANAKTFASFVRKSHFNNGMYYDNIMAQKNGNCYIYGDK